MKEKVSLHTPPRGPSMAPGPTIRGEGQQDRPRTLPEFGFIRLKEILEIIPISKSTWYKGIAEGRYPKQTKRFGPRIAAWDIRDIRALLDNKVA